MGRLIDATPKSERIAFGILLKKTMENIPPLFYADFEMTPPMALLFLCFYMVKTTIDGEDLSPSEAMHRILFMEKPDPRAVDLNGLAIEMMEAGEFQPPSTCPFSREDFLTTV